MESSGRGRRQVSDVEAWKAMQEHAWEVGMTARKEKSGLGYGLEERQRSLLGELDRVEERYRDLFLRGQEVKDG